MLLDLLILFLKGFILFSTNTKNHVHEEGRPSNKRTRTKYF